MIKANELRLGNIINWLSSDGWKFTRVNIKMLKLLPKREDVHEYLAAKDVPLTPELLEKCGFVKTKMPFTGEIGYAKSDEGNYFIGLVENAYGFSLHNPHFNLQIKYLHQLQNLYFALTGEELAIDMEVAIIKDDEEHKGLEPGNPEDLMN
jgi:hypothetical protein